jgi:hypothetical protein
MPDRRSSLPPRPSQRVSSIPTLHVPTPGVPVTTAPLELDAILPEDHHLVLSWAEALEHADYLALLDLPIPEGDALDEGELRSAFHVFAERFHPDAYPAAPDDVRDAAIAVFRLGAEAYRVLRDPSLRKRYLRLLGEGVLRLPAEDLAGAEKSERPRPTSAKQAARTAAAMSFATRADELIAAGDLRQARLQLQLAVMKEPDNEDLSDMLRALEEELARRKRDAAS